MNKGDTPLIKASFYGRTECLKILLNSKEINESLNHKEYLTGNTALIWATLKSHYDCVTLYFFFLFCV